MIFAPIDPEDFLAGATAAELGASSYPGDTTPPSAAPDSPTTLRSHIEESAERAVFEGAPLHIARSRRGGGGAHTEHVRTRDGRSAATALLPLHGAVSSAGLPELLASCVCVDCPDGGAAMVNGDDFRLVRRVVGKDGEYWSGGVPGAPLRAGRRAHARARGACSSLIMVPLFRSGAVRCARGGASAGNPRRTAVRASASGPGRRRESAPRARAASGARGGVAARGRGPGEPGGDGGVDAAGIHARA